MEPSTVVSGTNEDEGTEGDTATLAPKISIAVQPNKFDLVWPLPEKKSFKMVTVHE